MGRSLLGHDVLNDRPTVEQLTAALAKRKSAVKSVIMVCICPLSQNSQCLIIWPRSVQLRQSCQALATGSRFSSRLLLCNHFDIANYRHLPWFVGSGSSGGRRQLGRRRSAARGEAASQREGFFFLFLFLPCCGDTTAQTAGSAALLPESPPSYAVQIRAFRCVQLHADLRRTVPQASDLTEVCFETALRLPCDTATDLLT